MLATAGRTKYFEDLEIGQEASIRYPSLTRRLHHEVELVIAIGRKGQNIPVAEAHRHREAGIARCG